VADLWLISKDSPQQFAESSAIAADGPHTPVPSLVRVIEPSCISCSQEVISSIASQSKSETARAGFLNSEVNICRVITMENPHQRSMYLSICKDSCSVTTFCDSRFWPDNVIWISDVKPKMTLADEFATKPTTLTLLEYQFGNFYLETPADDSVPAIEQEDNGQRMTNSVSRQQGICELDQIPMCYLPNELILRMSIILEV
jgi:hypothetical protein